MSIGQGTGTDVRCYVVVRIDDAGTTDLHEHGSVGSAIGHPLREHLRGSRPADAHDQLRMVCVDEWLVAEQRIEGRDGVVELASR